MPRSHIARLNANGTLDGAFNPSLSGNGLAYLPFALQNAEARRVRLLLKRMSFTALGPPVEVISPRQR